ncbi:hypothetical protein OG500_00870 [Kitasatospora sp. NBC_01250]|uniref:hypothetical protein n=1 Tax=unclassified Kitasatospora TaxID=2633591 RepID=UPI002E0FC756|nr:MULTISPECIES: hypothetical protein [unclassified Kitasatospora]WSJ64744.1 hypothetical protein OG294_00780 [Kitasatospora sp. NBC_01302]
MTLTVSAVLFVGILLVVLVRNRQSTWSTACVAVTFGFLLASTNLAPDIHDLLFSVAATLNQLG